MPRDRTPVSPRCPLCQRPTRVTDDGLWTKHRERQDPMSPWCLNSSRDAS